MSCETAKVDSHCVDGRHQSAAISIEGDVTKTLQSKLFGKSAQDNREKTIIVSDNTIAAEGLGNFFYI